MESMSFRLIDLYYVLRFYAPRPSFELDSSFRLGCSQAIEAVRCRQCILEDPSGKYIDTYDYAWYQHRKRGITKIQIPCIPAAARPSLSIQSLQPRLLRLTFNSIDDYCIHLHRNRRFHVRIQLPLHPINRYR